MSDIITLKEWSAYLPWGVSCVYHHKSGQIESVILRPSNIQTVMDNGYKPILRPMDLTKQITHNGETIFPAQALQQMFIFDIKLQADRHGARLVEALYYGNVVCFIHDTMAVSRACHVGVFEWLVAHHFDVFGLLGRGLAEPLEEVKTK